ncbi:DUF4262 domain-containing protein [Dactylosporangium sp. NBC_01737]|uniref:DUF4262 domain-containing protein n=1 Tax=Dactylosporangium sp. NBC_01737 TaxID=2975959 RepID=UPI002E0E346F|nr:DUF4262 domain-containing protein [Dactylosporangium sp. NBC_01737]
MTTWLDPDRACSCHICAPDRTDDGCLDWRDATAALIRRHGWSVTGIDAEHDVPAWACTVGLWHTLGSPELAMFGLGLRDMQRWLNRLAGQIEAGRPLIAGQPRDDVLDGFALEIRPVHADWYPRLLGSALNFYQRPPLPVVQVVWPDRTGLFPWEAGSGDNCRADQPNAWLARDEHPPSIWSDLDDVMPWPFTGAGARTPVFTLHRVVAGAQVSGVVCDHDGSWQFLDGGAVTRADITTAHLHHVLARQPHIRAVADLRPGEQAWLAEDGTWHRSQVGADRPA